MHSIQHMRLNNYAIAGKIAFDSQMLCGAAVSMSGMEIGSPYLHSRNDPAGIDVTMFAMKKRTVRIDIPLHFSNVPGPKKKSV